MFHEFLLTESIKQHFGKKGSCWWEKIICCWERIMLVEKNHVLVGHLIMVAKDHVGGGRC